MTFTLTYPHKMRSESKTVDSLKPEVCFEMDRSLKTLRKLGLTNGMLSKIF